MMSLSGASISFKTEQDALVSLTRLPISCDVVISSRCLETSADAKALPRVAVSVQTSGVDLLMSTKRAEYVASAVETFEGCKTSSPSLSESAKALRPRIAKLSPCVLLEAQLSCDSFCLTIESEDAQDRVSKVGSLDATRVKGILFEEVISDFISHLSCYDLLSPAEDLINASVQLCVDRLTGLGIDREAAVDCVLKSREIFLSDLQEMKSQMLEEVKTAGSDASSKIDASGSEIDREAAESSASHQWGDGDDDDDSAESFDIIETTMKNAVERTVLAAMPLLNDALQPTLFDALIVESPGVVDITFSEFTYDTIFTLGAASLEVKNGRGINYLWIQPPAKVEAHGNSPGVHVSICKQDAGDQVGDGGYATSLLCDADAALRSTDTRSRETTIVMGMANVDVVFLEKEWTESVCATSSIIAALESPATHSHVNDSEASRTSPVMLAASIDSFSVLFASNEVVPFSRCEFQQVDIEAASASPANNWANHYTFISQVFKMKDLTPEGQIYPDFIDPLEESKADGAPPMLEISAVDPKDVWHQPMQVNGRMVGTRIIVLRRFVHELMQYMFTASVGEFGKFKAAHRTNFGVDEKGNTPPPLQYRLEVVGSSILLPVDSQSSDLVAVEADKITVCNSYVKESWRDVDDVIEVTVGDFGAAVKEGHLKDADLTRRSSSTMFFSPGSSSEEEFHDCVDSQIDQGGSWNYGFVDDKISSHNNSWMERVVVATEAAQIFTSFISSESVAERNGGSLRLAPRRAKEGCSVYTFRWNNGAIDKSTAESNKALCKYLWREVTLSCVDLEITTDFATESLMRILLRDHLSTRSLDSSRPFRLNMERAQLHILLSIWYRNVSCISFWSVPIRPYAWGKNPSNISAPFVSHFSLHCCHA